MTYSAVIFGRPYSATVSADLEGPYVKIKYGSTHGLAIDADGYLWATGYNNVGQLGRGNTTSSPWPAWVQIGTAKWKDIAVGGGASVGIQEDGSLWHWGNYVSVTSTSPVLLDSGDWESVEGSYNYPHFLAINSAGALYSWGYNGSGELGIGSYDNTNTPTLVDSGPWECAYGSDYTSVGLKSNGSLYVWGKTYLGDYWTTSSTPVLVGAGYKHCATGLDVVFGIKTDGTLWSWGYASYSAANGGLLGLDDIMSVYTPTQVAGSDWERIHSFANHALALQSTGAMYGWGANQYSCIDDSADMNIYIPRPIGETVYNEVYAGYRVSLALAGGGISVFWTAFKGQTER